MPACPPQARGTPIRQRLQTPVDAHASRVAEDRASEKGHGAKADRPAPDRSQASLAEKPVDAAWRVQTGHRHAVSLAQRVVDTPERCEGEDRARVGERRQAQAVIRSQHEPPARAQHARHLLNGAPRGMQPRDHADRDDQVVAT